MDWELNGLRGPVKAVRIEIEKSDQNGKPDKNGRWLHRLISYSPTSNKTEDETFRDFGKQSDSKHVYKYDDRGNLTGEAEYRGGTVSKTTFIYNDKAQVIREVKYNGEFHADYFYDSQGRLIETKGFYGKDTLVSRFVYTYNDKGQMIKWARQGGGLDFERTYTYTAQGKVASETRGSQPGDYYRQVVYLYDDRGNVIERKEYNEEGLEERTTYTYEFDSAGNWIKQIATVAGPIPEKMQIYRTITYY